MEEIQLTDPTGAEWEAFEVARSSPRRDSVPPHLADGWLCFQRRRDGLKIRVGKGMYPSNWRELAPHQLLDVMESGLKTAD